MKSFFSSSSKIAVGLVTGAALMVAPLAFAKTDFSHKDASIRKGVEVQINDSGRTIVRSAKVTAVSGSTITTSLAVGSTTLTWTVFTNSATNFTDKNGRSSGLTDVTVGDTVSFRGTLAAASNLAVNATVVKNWSKDKQVIQKHTFEGSVQSVASSSVPTSFVLKSGNTNYTVNVAQNTLVLRNNWTLLGLGSIKVGDTVRVYGSVQTNNTSVIDALVVRDVSIK